MTTSPASDRIADFGLDSLCEAVANGLTMRAIASSLGVSFGTLGLWIGAQPDRSARVRDARQHAAQLWDEKAEQAIIEATDALGLSKARELAQHYRWRASKIAPREYGDKMDLNMGGQGVNLIQVVTGVPRNPGDDALLSSPEQRDLLTFGG